MNSRGEPTYIVCRFARPLALELEYFHCQVFSRDKFSRSVGNRQQIFQCATLRWPSVLHLRYISTFKELRDCTFKDNLSRTVSIMNTSGFPKSHRPPVRLQN